MDAIKIPQNVYVEDRIVGPLTLRQVIICIIGCGVSYVLWSGMSKAYGVVGIPFQIAAWIPGFVSILFAFVRINDISMFRLCLLMVERMIKPPQRLWTPHRGIVINIRTLPKNDERNQRELLRQQSEKRTRAQIDALSSILEPENEDLQKNAARIPVDPHRITADPMTQESGNAQRTSVSLMRDIVPSHP